jgi:hypothetical protein
MCWGWTCTDLDCMGATKPKRQASNLEKVFQNLINSPISIQEVQRRICNGLFD